MNWRSRSIRYAAILLYAFLPSTLLLGVPHIISVQAASEPVLVGAGDIASCGGNSATASRAEATAKLLDSIDGTVFTLGDNAYNSGTAAQFTNCYAPTWGRHKARTYAAPGNHDYGSPGAAPYYSYFGSRVGPAGRGYYSYDLGDWHILSLNSNIAADVNSAQYTWVKQDLQSTHATCIAAYWHHPVFSSGAHSGDIHMAVILQLLYNNGADLILAGHDHNYERFAPQDPQARADPTGFREFVVGTGGAALRGTVTSQPNSQVRNNTTFGVIKLTLHTNSYNWEFVPVAGQSFRDTGSAQCANNRRDGSPANTPIPHTPEPRPSATRALPSRTPEPRPSATPGPARTVTPSVPPVVTVVSSPVSLPATPACPAGTRSVLQWGIRISAIAGVSIQPGEQGTSLPFKLGSDQPRLLIVGTTEETNGEANEAFRLFLVQDNGAQIELGQYIDTDLSERWMLFGPWVARQVASGSYYLRIQHMDATKARISNPGSVRMKLRACIDK